MRHENTVVDPALFAFFEAFDWLGLRLRERRGVHFDSVPARSRRAAALPASSFARRKRERETEKEKKKGSCAEVTRGWTSVLREDNTLTVHLR